MGGKQPLKQRIVIAFVVMTLLVSGAFSIGIVQTAHFIEEHLVSVELREELEEAMDKLGTGQPLDLVEGRRVFTTAGNKLLPPPPFAGAKEGFSEEVQGDEAFYVFKLRRDGADYLLVQDQQEFEAREQLLFDVVLAGFLFSLAIAWGLGALLANRVMEPVARLAGEVRSGNRISDGRRMAPHYADDEVGRLAAAFDTTFERLRRSLEREKLFTSDVSHELRTPLMVIESSCELLADAEGLGEKQRQQLQRVQRAGREMSELVQTLLMLAREQGVGSEGEVTLAEVAEQQFAQWRGQFESKGIAFRRLVEGEDSGTYNPIFLRTVMSNLLRNALHYTESGSVALVLCTGGFRVEDTGQGISVEEQSQLFKPFQRGERARGDGLGLGLSLVKRICAHQGWSVSMREAAPTGCIFQVLFAPDPATA